jgi:hypothetical protein
MSEVIRLVSGWAVVFLTAFTVYVAWRLLR